MKILVLDNYDSFVYNLVYILKELGGDVDVFRNDKISGRHPETTRNVPQPFFALRGRRFHRLIPQNWHVNYLIVWSLTRSTRVGHHQLFPPSCPIEFPPGKGANL